MLHPIIAIPGHQKIFMQNLGSLHPLTSRPTFVLIFNSLFHSPSPSSYTSCKMSISIFLLWLVSIPFITLANAAAEPPQSENYHDLPGSQGYFLSCGSKEPVRTGEQEYMPDEDYISGLGEIGHINQSNISPILSTVRSFHNNAASKFCYSFQVYKGGKFLVKTVYYYGGFDGKKDPPVFDQIIEGTKWSLVNTTEDYAQGHASYYEIIVMATGKNLSVCLAKNEHTAEGLLFISAIEIHPVDDPVYNSTDFHKYGLITVARHNFASAGDAVGFPDDDYNRFWEPLVDMNPVTSCHANVTPTVFWNNPPLKVFQTAITTSRGKTLKLHWPTYSLPSSNYYIALYFQDSRSHSPYSWRVFDININGEKFYSNVNVTASGVSVYATEWPLNGQTEVTLIPRHDMPVGPLINAGEVLQLLPLNNKTLTRDEVAMNELASKVDQNPDDWHGDPCMPKGYSWTGLTCEEGNHVRIVSLNLTSYGMLGSLPPSLGNLTALKHLWLADNMLMGNIPDFSQLHALETLHLENNKFEGPVPEYLAKLPNLKELYLQNNKLSGNLPESLANKDGLIVKFKPQQN